MGPNKTKVLPFPARATSILVAGHSHASAPQNSSNLFAMVILIFLFFFSSSFFTPKKDLPSPTKLLPCQSLLPRRFTDYGGKEKKKKGRYNNGPFSFFLLLEGRTLPNGFAPGLSRGQFHPLQEGVNEIRSGRALPPPAPGLGLTPLRLIPLQENNVDNSS